MDYVRHTQNTAYSPLSAGSIDLWSARVLYRYDLQPSAERNAIARMAEGKVQKLSSNGSVVRVGGFGEGGANVDNDNPRNESDNLGFRLS